MADAPYKPDQTQSNHQLTPRAVVLALLCVVLLSVLTPYIEIVLMGTQIGSFAPPGAALLILFALCGLVVPIMRIVARWRGGTALARPELLGIYVVLLAVAALPSCQFAGWLTTVTTGPFYYANETNQWQESWQYIPDWWGPRPPEQAEPVRQFYEGLRPGQAIPWHTWTKPLFAFAPMVLALYGAFLSLSVMLAPHWIDGEKLSFPLVQLPLELTDRPDRSHRLWADFFRNPVMWLGAAVPVFFHTLNGLHRYYPAIPQIPLRAISFDQAFVAKPWVAARPVRIDIYFCLIGFAFLCSRDVPVSIWVFWVVSKIEAVFGCMMGWTPGMPGRGLRDVTFPVVVAQQVGSTLAFLAIMLYAARPHLQRVWEQATGTDESPQARKYRMALIALLICFIVLCAWTVAGGMQAWMSVVLWILTLAFMVFVHRMMAEGGVNLLWAAQSAPNYLIFAFDGGRLLGPRTWLQLVSLPYFIWHFKGAVGPQSFEGLKLASSSGLRARRLLFVMAAAMAIAAVVGHFATVWMVLRNGGGVALDPYRFVHVGHRPMQEFEAVTGMTQGIKWQKIAGFVVSAAVTWGLSWLRWTFTWWRLHPIGYVLSSVFVIWYLWFSVFAGSTLNWVIHHYGGVRGFRAARPFFLGLIFGDFLMLGVWTVITAVTGVRGFQLFVT